MLNQKAKKKQEIVIYTLSLPLYHSVLINPFLNINPPQITKTEYLFQYGGQVS